MTTLNEKLIAFATEVGNDYRELKGLIEALQSRSQTNGQLKREIAQAITNLKNELMGGELDAQLDTLKELGDKLKEIEADDSIKGAILQKFTDINGKIQALEQWKGQVDELNLVQTYQQAKRSA